MIYKLINPSDPYTFSSASREVAALTVFLISTNYSAETENEDEEHAIPLFMFGGAEKWYKDTFGRNTYDGLLENVDEVRQSLCSFIYGNFEMRRQFLKSLKNVKPDKIFEYQQKYNSSCNTGLTNIAEVAYQRSCELDDAVERIKKWKQSQTQS